MLILYLNQDQRENQVHDFCDLFSVCIFSSSGGVKNRVPSIVSALGKEEQNVDLSRTHFEYLLCAAQC